MHLHSICFSPSVEPVDNDGMEDLTEDMEFDNTNQDDSAYESHFSCGKLFKRLCKLTRNNFTEIDNFQEHIM